MWMEQESTVACSGVVTVVKRMSFVLPWLLPFQSKIEFTANRDFSKGMLLHARGPSDNMTTINNAVPRAFILAHLCSCDSCFESNRGGNTLREALHDFHRHSRFHTCFSTSGPFLQSTLAICRGTTSPRGERAAQEWSGNHACTQHGYGCCRRPNYVYATSSQWARWGPRLLRDHSTDSSVGGSGHSPPRLVPRKPGCCCIVAR
mmetsp:Transcript_12256/g.27029  ORF Transcript_12256/g.27029 Transcript_12256/m.27029 type:complete len:204 (-) Transcript_12256:156-767(-)